MISFLAVSLAGKFENEVCQLQKEKTTRQKALAWTNQRLKLMTLLTCLYDYDLFQLWEPSSVAIMEDYSTLLTSACYTFLENPSVIRDKSLLEGIANLLGLAAVKYGLTLSMYVCVYCLQGVIENSVHFLVIGQIAWEGWMLLSFWKRTISLTLLPGLASELAYMSYPTASYYRVTLPAACYSGLLHNGHLYIVITIL